jgi:hypothetical protein
MADESKDAEILKLYTTPGHETSFSGVNRVAQFHKIGQKRAREALDKLDSYQLHREYHRPSVYNPYYIRKRRKLIQADLIDVRQWARKNAGVSYLLVIIDVFTRFLWVYPIKKKNAHHMEAAMARWLAESGQNPEIFETDGGLEFFNRPVRRLLSNANIRHELAVGTAKAAYAERVNRTIQTMLTKYMTHNNTRKYLDILPSIVSSYNRRPHRSLSGMTPRDADRPENEERVLAIANERYKSVKRKKPRYKLNDVVRVKIESKILTPASRSYNKQFNPDFYYIASINTKPQIPMYHLKAAIDDEPIEGGFYAEELTLVGGDEFKVEKIIDQRKRGRQREVLVRWQGFSPLWDTWVKAGQVRDVRVGRRPT